MYLFFKNNSQNEGADGKNIFANHCFWLQSEKSNGVERHKWNRVAPISRSDWEAEDPGLGNHSLAIFPVWGDNETLFAMQVQGRLACFRCHRTDLLHILSFAQKSLFCTVFCFSHRKRCNYADFVHRILVFSKNGENRILSYRRSWYTI